MLYLLTQALKNSKSINIWENLEKWRYALYIIYEKWTKAMFNSALPDSSIIINYNAKELHEYANWLQ